MRVVVNTSPLIALGRVGQLDVFPRMYKRLVCPQSVVDEWSVGLPVGLPLPTWLDVEPDPPEMVFRRELGAGEAAAVALAFNTRADLLVLDDLPARLVAADLGLCLTGTLGVLAAAQRSGLIASARVVGEALMADGFRIDPKLLRLLV